MTTSAVLAYEFTFIADVHLTSEPGPVLIAHHKKVFDKYTNYTDEGRSVPEVLFDEDFACEVYDECLVNFFNEDPGTPQAWEIYYQYSHDESHLPPEERPCGVVIRQDGDKIDSVELKEFENVEYAGWVNVTVTMEPID